MINLIIYELDQGNIDGARPKVMFPRRLKCANTFKIDTVKDTEVFTCPVCETDYVAVVKDGKVHLKSSFMKTMTLVNCYIGTWQHVG